MKYNRYLNGNYIVYSKESSKYYQLNKRALRCGEELKSEFPDSIDLKITNQCRFGCPYCHESSVPGGNKFNLEKTKEILEQLPRKPIEIAIGGGDVLECLDDLVNLVDWLHNRNNKPRITLNEKDFMGDPEDPKNKKITEFLNGKIDCLGISISSISGLKNLAKNISTESEESKEDLLTDNQNLLFLLPMGPQIRYIPHIVFHIIVGIFPISELEELIYKRAKYASILILGYKQWGRAKNTKLPDLSEWKETLSKILQKKPDNWTDSYYVSGIGFDNLACEQLDIKNIVGKKTWEKLYLGDEGSCSMYIDAVKGEYARTSRSEERVSWDNIKLLDFYASLSK